MRALTNRISALAAGVAAGDMLRLRMHVVAAGVLGAALAWQAGQVVLILIAPLPDLPRPAASASVDLSILSRFDPFSGQGSTPEGGAPPAVRLFGLRGDGAGGGSAIVALSDGQQMSADVGEALEGGWVLRSVGPDHIVIASGAATHRVEFGEAAPASGSASSAAPPSPAGRATGGPGAPGAAVRPGSVPTQTPQTAAGSAEVGAALASAGLRPRMKGLKMEGVVIGAATPALTAAGLRSGDVVTAVNGRALDGPSALNGLRASITPGAPVELRYERDGQSATVTLGGVR